MNKELLIEIFSEEIPARMQVQAQKDAAHIFTKLLDDHGAVFKDVATYVAPRRLVICVTGLEGITEKQTEVRRGPKTTAPDVALQGFLKSTGLNRDQLVEKDGYWMAHIENPGQAIEALLPKILHELLDSMPWPKSMRWYNPKTQAFTRPWVRPIRSILCVYSGETVEFHVDGLNIKTGNTTCGHRFLAPDVFTVSCFADYQEKLSKALVVLDHEERQKEIRDQIEKLLKQQHYSYLTWKEDQALLEEVSGLADFPYVKIEKIEDKFINLPSVVLATSLKNHQKCFTLLDTHGNATHLAMVFNHNCPSPLMMAGVQKVVRARLNDALFFYHTDCETSLETLIPKLDAIAYQEKLGSLGQKVKRLESLVPEGARQAAHLCKVDSSTQMVGEFPELQGVMGKIYALQKGYPKEIAAALQEHYLPKGPSDPLPVTEIGRELALWDKLDTLVGFLGVGIKPTGSKDPFALRRTAIGIIRLIVENEIKRYNLNEAIQRVVKAYADQGTVLASHTEKDVVAFIQDRLVEHLKTRGVAPEEVQAVLHARLSEDYFDLYSIAVRCDCLSAFLKSPEGDSLKAAYKRAKGILPDGFNIPVDESLLQMDLTNKVAKAQDLDAETNLYNTLKIVEESIPESLKNYHFKVIMSQLSVIKPDIDRFFENVLVNCDDEKIRQNNYALLAMFVNTVNRIADFGRLP